MINNLYIYIAGFFCFIIITSAFYQIYKLKKVIKNIITKIRTKKIQSYIDYENSLILSNNRKISFQRAEEIINMDNIFKHEHINIRHYLAIPSQLIGVGVLFTFVGLTIGLSGFSMSQLEESINNFISALYIKFYPSIAGMSLAIYFNFIEKKQFHNLEIEISNLCFTLDEKHYQLYERYFEDFLLKQFTSNQDKLSEISNMIRFSFNELIHYRTLFTPSPKRASPPR